MTAGELIGKFDSRTKNTVSAEDKLDHLARLDLRLYNEVWRDRAGAEKPVTPYTAQTALLVCEPYTDLYLRHLERERDLLLGDVDRFNAHSLLLRQAVDDYAEYVSRTYPPKSAVTRFSV